MLILKFGKLRQKIVPTIFPDKTSQVWKLDEEIIKEIRENECPKSVTILWLFEGEAEVMHLKQLHDLLRAVTNFDDLNICLNVPYLPYARQDKSISNEKTFARESLLNILQKSMGVSQIKTLDVHSDLFLSRYCDNNEIPHAQFHFDNDIICYPDKGAFVRYSSKSSGVWADNKEVIYLEKKRCESSGAITSLGIPRAFNEVDLESKSILIFDDICDGGSTFIRAASVLRERGAEHIELYTTHGIYSNGVEHLLKNGINKIRNYAQPCGVMPGDESKPSWLLLEDLENDFLQ